MIIRAEKRFYRFSLFVVCVSCSLSGCSKRSELPLKIAILPSEIDSSVLGRNSFFILSQDEKRDLAKQLNQTTRLFRLRDVDKKIKEEPQYSFGTKPKGNSVYNFQLFNERRMHIFELENSSRRELNSWVARLDEPRFQQLLTYLVDIENKHESSQKE